MGEASRHRLVLLEVAASPSMFHYPHHASAGQSQVEWYSTKLQTLMLLHPRRRLCWASSSCPYVPQRQSLELSHCPFMGCSSALCQPWACAQLRCRVVACNCLANSETTKHNAPLSFHPASEDNTGIPKQSIISAGPGEQTAPMSRAYTLPSARVTQQPNANSS